MVATRWVQALHNLYLITVAIAVIATVASVGAGPWPVAVAAGVLLAGADLAMRGRTGLAYFLGIAVALGVLTSFFPTFAAVAFGALPLAFVRLRWIVAVAVGILLTGLPFAIPSSLNLRIGPVYLAMMTVALPVLTGLFTARVIRSRQALVEELSTTRAQLAVAVRQAERQRVAHELHDTVAQGLSGVIMRLEAAEEHVDGSSPGLARNLASAQATARACLHDTRRAVAALRPQSLDGASLPAALAELTLKQASTESEVIALRVVQEALANAAKHSGAEEVTVTFTRGHGWMRLAVQDDGRGFDPEKSVLPNGFGIATMRERVASAGGTLAIASHAGHGTTVTATLPDAGDHA
jgi:signal transduction histidine kinase